MNARSFPCPPLRRLARRRGIRTACATVLSLAAAACDGAPTGAAALPRPVITDAAVAAGTHNVLSASVAVRATHAESVAVTYRLQGEPAAPVDTTPAVAVTDSSAVVPVLGLRPATAYLLRVVARGPGGATVGDSLALVTGALPEDLPRYAASGPAPSPGFVLFSSGRYVVVIDNDGRVAWYRRFADGAGLAVLAQSTGRYTLRPLTPDLADAEPWVELDVMGEVTRTLDCARGLRPRLHDLLLEPDGSYVLLCDETRTMDLGAIGGVSGARVTATVVQRVGSDGTLLFEWSPFDHFQVADLPAADRAGGTVNWTHGNSIDRDVDGDYLVSFRSLNEITKIDATTGSVAWRLGGPRNEFAFLESALPPFVRQHSARVAAPGVLVLLDNRGDPFESRAERYALDEGARTARLVQSHGSRPPVVTDIGGSVQALAGGRMLVSFGIAGRVEEVDGGGQVVWRIEGNPGYVFRAQRIASLYAPGAGTSR